MIDLTGVSFINTIEQVRALHPAPMSRATDKVLKRLDRHCCAILARSTFCIIGTQGEGADVSPRGDPPGFARVLDDRHILIPDRVGNNRFDSYANIFQNGRIGLLFLVPGMAETLRINGHARVTDDAKLLADSEVQGRAPKLGLLIEVHEAYLHCAKSINRAKLWDASHHISRDELPTYSEMLVDHCEGLTQDESEKQGAEMARRGMY
jgi:PPOX class probable FMN-dependent enzyme